MRIIEFGACGSEDGEKVTVQGTIMGNPLLQRYGRAKSDYVQGGVGRRARDGGLVQPAFSAGSADTGREIMLTGKWEQQRAADDGIGVGISG